MAKALYQNGFDGEGRKPGERSGLDIKNLGFLILVKNHLSSFAKHY